MINSNNNTETETFNCSGGNHTHQRDQTIFLQLIFFAMNPEQHITNTVQLIKHVDVTTNFRRKMNLLTSSSPRFKIRNMPHLRLKQ